MPHLGHILVGDSDDNTAKNRLLSLKHAGYKGWHASAVDDLQHLAAVRKPDVILLGHFASPASMEIARQFRENELTAYIPVFLLADSGSDAFHDELVETGIADTADYRVSTDVLLARLPRIVRSSRIMQDFERRTMTAADLGRDVANYAVPVPANEDADGRYCVLVVANERLFEKSSLSSSIRKNFTVELESNPYQATDLIDKGAFDAAVVMADVSDDKDKLGYFCTYVRSHSRQNNLPIIAINGVDQMDALYRVGASIVLDRSKDAARAPAHLKLLINRQRYLRTLLRPLDTILGPQTADSELPNAYSAEFFRTHLRRSIFSAIDRETSVGVASFTIPTIARVRDTSGAEKAKQLRKKVLNRLKELVRITDTVAVLGEYEFGVILCDADDNEGYRIANRITGIMQSTEYWIDESEPVRIIVQCGVAGLKPADDAEKLVTRARENRF